MSFFISSSWRSPWFTVAVSGLIIGAIILCGLTIRAKAQMDALNVAAAKIDLAGAYNRFGFALFDRLSSESPTENVVMSPTSVAVALAMTANGANGDTREGMLEMLNLPNADVAAVDDANASLLTALRDPSTGVTLSLANAIWVGERFPIRRPFLEAANDWYGATAQALPFGNPSAAKTINAWVNTNTGGLIPTIVESTDPDDVAFLTNAISMKAQWLQKFKKRLTHADVFHADGNASVNVSMMAAAGEYGYAENPTWQIARLPYASDRFAMYVLLPREHTALREAVAKLDAASFDKMLAGIVPQPIELQMPRYTASYKNELSDLLSRLGMRKAFSPEADFSNLTPTGAKISKVNHRAYVRVDEDGTQAAAATSVDMVTMMRPMAPKVTMIVNRPFVFAIRDDQTRQVLFLGAIVHPGNQ